MTAKWHSYDYAMILLLEVHWLCLTGMTSGKQQKEDMS